MSVSIGQNKKAPDLHQAGLRFNRCEKFDYARTSPKALGGFVVFVVVFAVEIMARTYAGEICRRQPV